MLLKRGGFLPVKSQGPWGSPGLKLKVNGLLVGLGLVRGNGAEGGGCNLSQARSLGNASHPRPASSLREPGHMSGLLVSLIWALISHHPPPQRAVLRMNIEKVSESFLFWSFLLPWIFELLWCLRPPHPGNQGRATAQESSPGYEL